LWNIKRANSSTDELIKDLKKLTNFRRKLNYIYLVEVVIGNESELLGCRSGLLEKLRKESSEFEEITTVEFNTDKWKADHYEVEFPMNAD